jgi:hypothetical protein
MKQVPVKAYTLKELYTIYEVSRHVFSSWLTVFGNKVGVLKGKTYTPKQVKIIFAHIETPEIYKARTVKELCALYGVSKSVFFSWIKLFRERIGVFKGKTYTPKQVRIILEHLEMPDFSE